jgi:hypothetical protein
MRQLIIKITFGYGSYPKTNNKKNKLPNNPKMYNPSLYFITLTIPSTIGSEKSSNYFKK